MYSHTQWDRFLKNIKSEIDIIDWLNFCHSIYKSAYWQHPASLIFTNTFKFKQKQITLKYHQNPFHCVPHLVNSGTVLIFYVFHRHMQQTGMWHGCQRISIYKLSIVEGKSIYINSKFGIKFRCHRKRILKA